MDIQRIQQYQSSFDAIRETIEGEDGQTIEVWFARTLQRVFGYVRWGNFLATIGRAIASCQAQGISAEDHFRPIRQGDQDRKGEKQEPQDYMLTRFACYLIAQNGDPKKEEIAFAQGYFALQTRKAELIAEHLEELTRLETRDRLRSAEKQLSRNISQRGIDAQSFARIRSQGDTALFGGHTTEEMKERLGVKPARPLADFLPTITIAAKNLATEMTNYHVAKENLYGETTITDEHVQNNLSVRQMLGERGIRPEELPASEDIKKTERRISSQGKELEKTTGHLPPEKKS